MITIVTIFTIFTINHNCRNANHNCRKKNTIVVTPTTIVAILISYNCRNLDQLQLSQSWSTQHQSQMSQFFWTYIAYLILILYKIMTFHPIFNNPYFTSHNLTMTLCNTLAHHRTILQSSQIFILKLWLLWNSWNHCCVIRKNGMRSMDELICGQWK